MPFKITVALLIFYLDDMPIDISGVLKFSTVIVLLLSSFFILFYLFIFLFAFFKIFFNFILFLNFT